LYGYIQILTILVITWTLFGHQILPGLHRSNTLVSGKWWKMEDTGD